MGLIQSSSQNNEPIVEQSTTTENNTISKIYIVLCRPDGARYSGYPKQYFNSIHNTLQSAEQRVDKLCEIWVDEFKKHGTPDNKACKEYLEKCLLDLEIRTCFGLSYSKPLYIAIDDNNSFLMITNSLVEWEQCEGRTNVYNLNQCTIHPGYNMYDKELTSSVIVEQSDEYIDSIKSNTNSK